MGYLGTIITAIFCASAPLVAAEAKSPEVERSETTFKLGKEIVHSVRSSYENGKFNQFMFDMDEVYRKADLKEMLEARQSGASQNISAEFEHQLLDLRNKKNNDLLGAIDPQDQSIFAAKVRSLAAEILTPEQEKAVSKIHSFISMPQNGGANIDENTLIDIDIEYEYKLLHAPHPDLESPEHRQSRQIALRMEKMDKMLQASKSFQDKDLKKAVRLAHSTLDARLARNLDGTDLNTRAKKKSDSGKNEETVYSILRSYQGQFSDLIQELR